jgi:gliding motility-associated-like protein
MYLLFRSEGLYGANRTLIDSLPGLNNLTYTDKKINTDSGSWSYTLELWNTEPGNRYMIGEPQVASQLYLKAESYHKSLKLVFDKNVPWTNDRYVIYRQSGTSEDSIGFTTGLEFYDRGLEEGRSYCYRVKSVGKFVDLGITGLINYSQIECAVPIDTLAPCPPILEAKSVCDSLANYLTWNNVNDSCSTDAASYRIYYRNTIEGDLALIDSVQPATKTFYWHYPDKTMAGCYAVTAVDSVGNESGLSNIVCLDDCINYSIPNVFTPNGDGINDILKPNPYNRVEKINLKIFSRWNTLVFETEDPEINWDGHHIRNGKTVPPGVYYYVCEVFEHRLTGLEPRYLTGFIHVLTSDVQKRN